MIVRGLRVQRTLDWMFLLPVWALCGNAAYFRWKTSVSRRAFIGFPRGARHLFGTVTHPASLKWHTETPATIFLVHFSNDHHNASSDILEYTRRRKLLYDVSRRTTEMLTSVDDNNLLRMREQRSSVPLLCHTSSALKTALPHNTRTHLHNTSTRCSW